MHHLRLHIIGGGARLWGVLVNKLRGPKGRSSKSEWLKRGGILRRGQQAPYPPAMGPGERCNFPQWSLGWSSSRQEFWCYLCSRATSPAMENRVCSVQVYRFSHFVTHVKAITARGPQELGAPVYWTAWTPGFSAFAYNHFQRSLHCIETRYVLRRVSISQSVVRVVCVGTAVPRACTFTYLPIGLVFVSKVVKSDQNLLSVSCYSHIRELRCVHSYRDFKNQNSIHFDIWPFDLK